MDGFRREEGAHEADGAVGLATHDEATGGGIQSVDGARLAPKAARLGLGVGIALPKAARFGSGVELGDGRGVPCPRRQE